VAIYPAHSTHRLQPLDIGLFSPLANYYSQELDRFMAASQGYLSITKREFFALFWPAWQKAFTKRNIDSAWAKAGIWPWSPTTVLQSLQPQCLESASNDASEASPAPIDPGLTWRPMRQAISEAIASKQQQKVWVLVEQLQASKELLIHENSGLKEALRAKKKKEKPKKALFDDDNISQDGWYSPAKIGRQYEVNYQREEQERQEQEAKEAAEG
jgi:hypothetical protein